MAIEKNKLKLLTTIFLICLAISTNATTLEDFEDITDWTTISATGGAFTTQDTNSISGKAARIETDGDNDSQKIEVKSPVYTTGRINLWINTGEYLNGGISGSTPMEFEVSDTNTLYMFQINFSPTQGLRLVTDLGATNLLPTAAVPSWTWYNLQIAKRGNGAIDVNVLNEEGVLINGEENIALYWAWEDTIRVVGQITDDLAVQRVALFDTMEDYDNNITFSSSTSGEVWWEEEGYSFTESNLKLDTMELPEERITILFNYNWQIYEFTNDLYNPISEELEIITTSGGTATAKYRDLAAGEVEGATVRVYELDTDTNSWKLTNQIYTDASGEIQFNAEDVNSIVKLEASKSGYETGTRTVRIEPYIAADGPTILILSGQDLEIEKGRQFWTDTPLQVSSTTTANVYFTALDEYTVCFREYYDGAQIGSETCSTGTTIRYQVDVNTADVNFFVEALIGGALQTTFTFQYVQPSFEGGFTFPTPVGDEETQDYFFVLFIMLIILAAIGDALFTKGLGTFFIGSMFLTTVPGAGLYFLPMALCAVMYYFSGWAKEYWSG